MWQKIKRLCENAWIALAVRIEVLELYLLRLALPSHPDTFGGKRTFETRLRNGLPDNFKILKVFRVNGQNFGIVRRQDV